MTLEPKPSMCWDKVPAPMFILLTWLIDMDVSVTPPNSFWQVTVDDVVQNVTSQEWLYNHRLQLNLAGVIPDFDSVIKLGFPLFNVNLRSHFGICVINWNLEIVPVCP